MKSPREVYLEHEISLLKEELKYYKGSNNNSFSYYSEPITQYVDRATNTLYLAARGGWKLEDGIYHLYAKEYGFNENKNIYYYISDRELLDSWDRVAILQNLLEKTTTALIQDVIKEI